MGNKQLEIVKKEVLRKGIYDDCEYLGTWNGYEVYNPFFKDGITRELGLPEFIVVKNGAINFIQDEKIVFEIMDFFY